MLETKASNISRPFIIYSGNDISGTVGGNPSVEKLLRLGLYRSVKISFKKR